MFNSIYEVKITGKNVLRFIKQMNRLGIELYNIRYYGKSVYIKVDEAGYLKLSKMKTIYKVEVIRLYGKARIIDLIKRNYIFLLFVIFGFFLLLALTKMIWEIEVVHSKKEIRNLIYRELDDRGIKKYHLVLSFDEQEKIAQDIMDKHKDKIEWLEIERIGVKYVIKVEERIINAKKKQLPNRDLVASKDGIITNINASQGEIVKKINDYVKKGEVIVSGNIMKDDEVKKTISANGRVFAETWYEVNVTMPLHYREIIKSSKTKNNINVFFLNKKFSLFNYGNSKETKKIFRLKNKIFPMGISFDKEHQTKIIDEVYTVEEAGNKAILLAEERLKKTLDEDEYIISRKKLKMSPNGSTILVKVFFKVNEDITSYKEITKEDIKKLTEEKKKAD